MCAGAWALNPALSGEELRSLVLESAKTPVSGAEVGLLDMAAVMEAAAKGAKELPSRPDRELALDAYAALLHEGVELKLGAQGSNSAEARFYTLLDVDEDDVQELLLYALDEREMAAGFALYGFREGEAVLLADSWNTCRFSSWSNVTLTLELWDGKALYAGAERSSAGYGDLGERFWLSFEDGRITCTTGDHRPTEGLCIPLIENSVVTTAGIRIGSARDLLWER